MRPERPRVADIFEKFRRICQIYFKIFPNLHLIKLFDVIISKQRLIMLKNDLFVSVMDLFWSKIMQKFVMINDMVAEAQQCFPCLLSK